MLTGISSPDSINLLEKYLERSGDIQSVVLLLSCSPGSFQVLDERIDEWIQMYRTLLDRWQLYHVRARFDISRRKVIDQNKLQIETPPQVSVKCNFCNQLIVSNSSKKITLGGSQLSLSTTRDATTSSTKSRYTSCPTCRKPLPKCSLCLLNMGTPFESQTFNFTKSEIKDGGFDIWWTFCTLCGHARHALDWFENQKLCPVSDCNCSCNR